MWGGWGKGENLSGEHIWFYISEGHRFLILVLQMAGSSGLICFRVTATGVREVVRALFLAAA